MDATVQCRGIFYKFGCSGKDYVEAFNFRVQIKKDVKNVKEFKVIIRYLFLLFFLGPFYLVCLLQPRIAEERRSFDDTPNLCLKHRMAYILWFHFGRIFNAYRSLNHRRI